MNANSTISNAIQPLIESLESRRLLAATLVGTQLNVDGSNTRSDSITVDIDDAGTIAVSINGRESEFSADDVATLRVRGLNGNDRIELTGQFDDFDILASVFGNAGRDTILGSDAPETIFGGTGNDSILGGGGDDDLFGEDGNDIIDGEAGDDSIVGAAGFDDLYGSDDNDLIRGGAHDDYVDGGDGNDDLFGDNGHDRVKGGFGNDSI